MSNAAFVLISNQKIMCRMLVKKNLKVREVHFWAYRYKGNWKNDGVLQIVPTQKAYDSFLRGIASVIDFNVLEESLWIIEYPRGLRGHANNILFRLGLVAAHAEEYVLVQPSQIRKIVCGNGKATKDEVRKAVREYFRKRKLPLRMFDNMPKEIKKYDEHLYDATAAAIYGMEVER